MRTALLAIALLISVSARAWWSPNYPVEFIAPRVQSDSAFRHTGPYLPILVAVTHWSGIARVDFYEVESGALFAFTSTPIFPDSPPTGGTYLGLYPAPESQNVVQRTVRVIVTHGDNSTETIETSFKVSR